MPKTLSQRGGLRRKLVIGATALVVAAGAAAAAGTAGAEGNSTSDAEAQAVSHRVPFPCGQKWRGETRSDHSPTRAVDFNRANDIKDKVAASAAGTVVHRGSMAGTSYGKLVVIKHRNGTATYYAHLHKFDVKKGEKVSKGEIIGFVGGTGHPDNPGGFGSHLHYEQRTSFGGTSVKIKFNNKNVVYYGERNYTVKCG